jgi:tRNA(Ile)-lysidine synthase
LRNRFKEFPDSFAAAFQKAARALDLFGASRPLLAAVSGGADSMALLYALKAFAPPGFPLSAVHVNHGIRGRSADRDAAFVRARCAELGVPLVEGRLDVPAVARQKGLAIEMAARRERYAFFRDALQSAGGSAVVTAHTADDQAETVLLKLIRGAGPRGLSGMAPSSNVLGVPVLRPLLAVRRPAVEAYLREQGRTWRTDPTNADTRLLRNRVRHKLLPLLERDYNPGIREALCRTAAVLREEEKWLLPLAEQALAEAIDPEGRLIAARLAGRNPALVRRVMRMWLVRGGVPEEKLDFDLVGRLERLLESAAGTLGTEAGGHLRIVSEYGCWRLENAAETRDGALPEAAILAPGTTPLPEWGLTVRVTPARGFKADPPPGFGRYPCRAWVSASLVRKEGLTVRPRRPGDALRLPAGARKLQDLLTDAKVPRAERSRIPVIASGSLVLWAAGGPVSLCGRVPGPRSASFCLEIGRLAANPP